MIKHALFGLLSLASSALAQPTEPSRVDVPALSHAVSAKTPVVLINGFQLICGKNTDNTLTASVETFGQLASLLQQDGIPVAYFNNCAYQDISIEQLAAQLNIYIAGLRYTDGTPIEQVDVVAHSMGGLILRSYLSGKVTNSNSFVPPATTKIRKAIFIATPHFGTGIANLGSGVQVDAMRSGSPFLFSLATWNQGLDDLRGVDSIAVIGNAGTAGQSDGLVRLTSASLTFAAEAARTRVVPYCHTDPGLLLDLAYGCSALSIAKVASLSHQTYQIISSFLADTSAWQTIGTSPSSDPYLAQNGGLGLLFEDANENAYTDVTNAFFTSSSGAITPLSQGSGGTFYADFVSAALGTLHLQLRGLDVPVSYRVNSGGYHALLVKYPPLMSRTLPAAGLVNTLSVAAGSFISIYGSGLAQTTASASSLTFPSLLGGTSVTANGQPLGLLSVSDGQINAYLPQDLSGLVRVQVNNALGHHGQNVLMAPAVPAIFTQDRTGTGPGAITHAISNQLVTPSNPAAGGEFVSIYLTGLGITNRVGALDYAVIQPQVVFGTSTAVVTFSGLAPGYLGLYQINAQVPTQLHGPAVPVTVQAAGVQSNIVTIAIQ